MPLGVPSQTHATAAIRALPYRLLPAHQLPPLPVNRSAVTARCSSTGTTRWCSNSGAGGSKQLEIEAHQSAISIGAGLVSVWAFSSRPMIHRIGSSRALLACPASWRAEDRFCGSGHWLLHSIGLYQVDVAWSPFGAVELATPEEPGWAPSCRTGPGPKRPTRAPTGCGWTCGPPTSAFSTTTCAKASPTSALSSCPTILPGALFQRPAQRVPTPHLEEVESLTGCAWDELQQLSRREPRSPTAPRVEGSGRTVLACPTPSRKRPTNQLGS
jgi:hypothetical protein